MNAKSILPLFVVLSFNLSAQENQTETFGKNLITFSPMHLYGSDYINDIAIGVSYERVLTNEVALQVPLAVGLNENLVQAGIGIKLYPKGHEGKVKYAIAPTLLFSTSHDEYDYYVNDGLSSYYYYNDRTVYQLGFSLMHSLNVSLNSKFYLGAEGGIGVNYVTWVKNNSSSPLSRGPDVNGMLRANFGYRF